ncbi:MAG: hypothetical protein ACQEP1_04945 [Nanobdellota archaeon]
MKKIFIMAVISMFIVIALVGAEERDSCAELLNSSGSGEDLSDLNYCEQTAFDMNTEGCGEQSICFNDTELPGPEDAKAPFGHGNATIMVNPDDRKVQGHFFDELFQRTPVYSLFGFETNHMSELGETDFTGDVTLTSGAELCTEDTCLGDWSETKGLYVGKSSAETDGDPEDAGNMSYDKMNEICQEDYAGSHLCTETEMINSVNNKDISSESGLLWVSGGAPGYLANANDCNGWTKNSEDFFGKVWDFGEGNKGAGYMARCTASLNLACCKEGGQ